MDKQTQDRMWAVLSKYEREAKREAYRYKCSDKAYNKAVNDTLEALFGTHNLTSDTEPEEMFVVSAKKVRELYSRFSKYLHESHMQKDAEFYKGEQNAFVLLFGDKCLPDQIVLNVPSGGGGMNTTPPVCKLDVETKHISNEDVCKIRGVEIVEYDTPNTPNFDVSNDNNPKYSKGDSVLHIPTQIVYDVVEYIQDRQVYKLQRMSGVVTAFAKESELEPYKGLEHRLEQTSVQVEPKFHKGDKVLDLILADICTIENYNAKTDRYQLRTDAGSMIFRDEKDLEPYTEPETTRKNTQELSLSDKQGDENKDSMEEKELNLAELLKGCEGEEFYTPLCGNITFSHIESNTSYPILCYKGDKNICFTLDGNFYNDYIGKCLIYPSRALYEKYPLAPYSAWMEWKEARKPKRWTPKNGEKFWHLNEFMNGVSSFYNEDDLDDYTMVNKSDNCFQTYELCQQAAEAVRDTLNKIHESFS